MIRNLLNRFFKAEFIGGPGYMRRWHLLVIASLIEVYLHRFQSGDGSRDAHDHPWLVNITIVLRGAYNEELPVDEDFFESQIKRRRAGRVCVRFGKAVHRIPDADPGTWTLFIGLFRWRNWGFYPGGRFMTKDAYKALRANN